jgi:hypothetical protein
MDIFSLLLVGLGIITVVFFIILGVLIKRKSKTA